jgi:DNA-binding transcriptional regulator YiaG
MPENADFVASRLRVRDNTYRLMQALLGTEFAALLARADVSQAGFARLTGYTTRQVNNWCRTRAAVPTWTDAAKVPPA